MNWYYAENDRQVGPVTDEEFSRLSQAGKITENTFVWHEGMPQWLPYREAMAKTPPPTLPPSVPGSSVSPNANEVVCAECGKVFPVGDTISIGNTRVCAACKPVFLQKLSEGAEINTGAMNYAGFGIRLGAKLLDGLILGVPCAIIFFALMFPTILQQIRSANSNAAPTFSIWPSLAQLAYLLVNFLYQTFFLGKYGATPGKMICKIKVVTSEGDKISYPRAIGRFFAEMLSGLICYIGYIMVAFDGEKRALHDHICNTRVVHK